MKSLSDKVQFRFNIAQKEMVVRKKRHNEGSIFIKGKRQQRRAEAFRQRITKTTKSPGPSVMKGQEIFCLLIFGAFRDTSIDR